MKLAWIFCLLLAGKLSTASPDTDERAVAEANLGSGYMMAFPMNDDHLAEESAQEAVKILAESLASDNDDDEDDDDDNDSTATEQKKEEATETAEKKDDQTEQPEPMGILQAELDAEDEAQKPALPQRPFFKRPKIDELRKILGFPPPESPTKAKPIPQEKPKVFQNVFNKPKPKIEQSPLGGLQFNLRREDRMRPFGFPMLPLKRDDSFRPFGIPDLVQAASTILRRAIIDDNNENDISKDDKEEEEPQNQINENEPEDNEEDEEDESVMIVPLPDPKEVTIERPPLFRRFPIPLPFPVPRPAPQTRPRLPFPPLTPVAFFLPIAQQIMQNIRHSQPRSAPPMIPLAPMHPMQQQIQHLLPIQTQIPIVPIQHQMQQQQFIPIQHQMQQQQFIPIQHQMQQQQFIPIQHQMQQQQFIPIHQPFIPLHQPVQQIMPFFHIPQASIHVPILTPLPPNMQRPVLRQMPRRMPVHPPPPPPQMARRMPFPNPMSRMANQQPHPHMQSSMINPMVRRPMQPSVNRPMQRVVRPPMPPVHPVLFMMAPMPVPTMHVPIVHHQPMPSFHRPQQVNFVPQQMHAMSQPRHVFQPVQGPEEERVVFIRPDQDDQDDDQEVLILVPSDEVEVAQRPPMFPPQLSGQIPTPVVNPLQRIQILRDLLLARQANRQPMSPEARASRVVEIVQQQLRIFPAHHPQVQMQQRPEASELHPVYVPYPGPQ